MENLIKDGNNENRRDGGIVTPYLLEDTIMIVISDYRIKPKKIIT